MGVALTAAGESLMARLHAEGKRLLIDRFLFAHIPGQDSTAPVDIGQGVPIGHIVHDALIPEEYRAWVNPNEVVCSALLTSDIGPFEFNWQGLYCSEYDTLIQVATFPTLQKKAYDPSSNTAGNNFTRNMLLTYFGARELTGITIEASTWQLDFTVRLKGIDERERLSNRDIYGDAAFMGEGWQLAGSGGSYAFKAGYGYIAGIRAALEGDMPFVPAQLPCDVWLDLSMPRVGSDVVTDVAAVTMAVDAWPENFRQYREDPPIPLMHYCAKVARIAADGTVTCLRPKGLQGDALTPATLGAVAESDLNRVTYRELITASGAWTPPGTGWYRIRGVAGGGGGASLNSPSGFMSAGGGGSSGEEADIVIHISSLDPIPVTIGAAGLGANVSNLNAVGGNGGVTSFGAYFSLNGGLGAPNSASPDNVSSRLEVGAGAAGPGSNAGTPASLRLTASNIATGFIGATTGAGGSSSFGAGGRAFARNASDASSRGYAGAGYGAGAGGSAACSGWIGGNNGSPGCIEITRLM